MRVAAGSDFLGAFASVWAFALGLGLGLPVWARAGPAMRPAARNGQHGGAHRHRGDAQIGQLQHSISPDHNKSAGPGDTAIK